MGETDSFLDNAWSFDRLDSYLKQLMDASASDRARLELAFNEYIADLNARPTRLLAAIAFLITTALGLSSLGQIAPTVATYVTIGLIGIALLGYFVLGIPGNKVTKARNEITGAYLYFDFQLNYIRGFFHMFSLRHQSEALPDPRAFVVPVQLATTAAELPIVDALEEVGRGLPKGDLKGALQLSVSTLKQGVDLGFELYKARKDEILRVEEVIGPVVNLARPLILQYEQNLGQTPPVKDPDS